MNERIEQLALECYRAPEFDYKKFAELIVRESGKYLMSPEFIGRSDLDWDTVLKEHFGVKE